jgi:hypothetical protein
MAQYSLQVHHALAKPIPYGSAGDMALPFILVVITANLVKAMAFILAPRICSTGRIVTIGDAISSFLEIPEDTTRGKCTPTKRKLVRPPVIVRNKLFYVQEKLLILVTRGEHGISTSIV